VSREDRRVEVRFDGERIAATDRPVIVRETASAPVFYIPKSDVSADALRPSARSSFCEWKGPAAYFDVTVGDRTAAAAAFEYPDPSPHFRNIRGHVAFYAQSMDRCTVDGEPASPQPGGFYAGWVLPWVLGPIKGEPGTQHW
jgi:uncharacterized protein (DUF427 family)